MYLNNNIQERLKVQRDKHEKRIQQTNDQLAMLYMDDDDIAAGHKKPPAQIGAFKDLNPSPQRSTGSAYQSRKNSHKEKSRQQK